MMTILKASQALAVYQLIDGHELLSPRQIAYLCVFAFGQTLTVKEVGKRFGSTPEAAGNHVSILKNHGFIQRGRKSGYQITGDGVKLIRELFPHTYVSEGVIE